MGRAVPNSQQHDFSHGSPMFKEGPKEMGVLRRRIMTMGRRPCWALLFCALPPGRPTPKCILTSLAGQCLGDIMPTLEPAMPFALSARPPHGSIRGI